MKDVYQKTPQMGDPNSLEPKISETLGNIERLRLEVQKCEVRDWQAKGGGSNSLAFSRFLTCTYIITIITFMAQARLTQSCVPNVKV